MRKRRSRCDRLRAMRFALWAQHQPSASLTPQLISAVLDVSLTQAREWRTELFKALSPMDAEGLPPSPRPAANGPTTSSRTPTHE
ncbi:hypothetical protein EDC50_1025 [Vulcaniibacterium tengchongense]|uniref:Uncharacterized protein n=1 Tax=Vulcaniibacterium tengchongense TaxID=1273429 RepID=A0A3N4VJE8_9GAMM|nr:hypothetical protein EDC50_1025 [Vulcaniibacterium tengchongense]